jgi:hypothetical protein
MSVSHAAAGFVLSIGPRQNVLPLLRPAAAAETSRMEKMKSRDQHPVLTRLLSILVRHGQLQAALHRPANPTL